MFSPNACICRRQSRAIRDLACLMVLAVGLFSYVSAEAQEFALPWRQIYVPEPDLPKVLEAAGKRVFLKQAEFDDLVKRATQKQATLAPIPYSIVRTQYDGRVMGHEMLVTGTMTIDVAQHGIFAVPLSLGNFGILSATIDDEPAALGRRPLHAQNTIQQAPYDVVLFVEGVGSHELTMELVGRVNIEPLRQTVQYALPKGASGSLKLTVPGFVEPKSGPVVLSHRIDEAAATTTLELALSDGIQELVLSRNHRATRDELVIHAQSVHVAEVAEAYERTHLSVAIEVLHGAADQISFQVPADFEVFDVSAPTMSEWQVDSQTGVLRVQLQEPLKGGTAIQIVAQRRGPRPESWTMPRVEPLGMTHAVSLAGILVEPRLNLAALKSDQAIPVDVQTLMAVLPHRVTHAEDGAPLLTPVAAYYIVQDDTAIAGRFERATARFDVRSRFLVTAQDSGLHVGAGFIVSPSYEPIRELELQMPSSWNVLRMVDANGQPIAFDTYTNSNGTMRLRIALPSVVQSGVDFTFELEAETVPEMWLSSWETFVARVPQILVVGAATDQGGIAIRSLGDFDVVAGNTAGISPLDSARKSRYQLDGHEAPLAYSYEQRPWSLEFELQRKKPETTVEHYSFFQLHNGNYRAHYELVYHVTGAKTPMLEFQLPASTPSEMRIEGLDGLVVKESKSTVVDNMRQWHVELAQPSAGVLRLAASFDTPWQSESKNDTTSLALPVISTPSARYHSGSMAVESSEELTTTLETTARSIDVGALVDARYQPADRLIGSYAFVGTPPVLTARIAKPELYALPAAIVQRAELLSVVSPLGKAHSVGRFQLRTKAAYIVVRLPSESQLWSVMLDDIPAKPQLDAQRRLVVSVPTRSDISVRDLRLVWQQPIDSVSMWGTLTVDSPQLYLPVPETDSLVELPLVDVQWEFAVPPSHTVSGLSGTVHPMSPQIFTSGNGLFRRAWIRWAQPLLSQARYARLQAGSRLEYAASSPAGSEPNDLSSAQAEDLDYSELSEQASSAPQGEMPKDQAAAPPPVPPAVSEPGRLASPAVARGEESAAARAKGQVSSGAASKAKLWVLEGMRSLPVELHDVQGELTAQSLGGTPIAELRVIETRAWTTLAWIIAFFVVAIGLLGVKSTASRLRFFLGMLLLGTAVPVVMGWGNELALPWDYAVFATLLLAAFWLVVGLVSLLARVIGPRWVRFTTAGCCLVACLAMPHAGHCQEVSSPASSVHLGPLTVRLDELTPIQVPENALVYPYADLPVKRDDPNRTVIVPLSLYEQLRQVIEAEKDRGPAKAPQAYAVTKSHWSTELTDESSLIVDGELEVIVFRDEAIWVPFAIGEGVSTEATLDGQPARIHFVRPDQRGAFESVGAEASETNQASTEPPGPGEALAVVQLAGRGRHELRWQLRFPVARQAGWREVHGVLPRGAAAPWTIRVPQASTELRTSGTVTDTVLITEDDQEVVQTALAPAGPFNLRWRPKADSARVDRGLTVQSRALFDIQEDRHRLLWELNYIFPQAERDSLEFTVPEGFVVEKVMGENVKSWIEKDRVVRLDLLQPAADQQTITVQLADDNTSAASGTMTTNVPAIAVPGAMLHQGRIGIRRSPWLELKVETVAGASRGDFSDFAIAGGEEITSPLGIRDFQAFDFQTVPYSITLEGTWTTVAYDARIESLWRIDESEQTVESRVVISPRGRPIYSLSLTIPTDLDIESVDAPGNCHWHVSENNGTQQLALFLAQGQPGDFAVVLVGRIPRGHASGPAAVPAIIAPEARQSSTEIIVQTAPGWNVETDQLQGLERISVLRTSNWLNESQRSFARTALKAETATFSGQVLLSPRDPEVRCQMITNVRVTNRAFEETLMLDYLISNGGVREIEFRLPTRLRNSHITAPLVRAKSIVDDPDGEHVVVRLTLQDAVIGQYRVLVSNDIQVHQQAYTVPIPMTSIGTVTRQFVTLENVSRDEVLIEGQDRLLEIQREQRDWSILSQLLGVEPRRAFVSGTGDGPIRLVLRIAPRAQVETVDARILLSETVIVLDENGVYRGRQVYHVDNRTEPYLEVQLPKDATLWAAFVDGRPLKPMQGTAGSVRIPLVKTAAGERDYPVELKYGGQRARLGLANNINFPFIEPTNIRAQESQVRIFVPDSYNWIRFHGSLGAVASREQLNESWRRYKLEQLASLKESLSSASPYAKYRARLNAEQVTKELKSFELDSLNKASGLDIAEGLPAESQVVQQTVEALTESSEADDVYTLDNRQQLKNFYQSQSNAISRDQLRGAARNFNPPSVTSAPAPANQPAGNAAPQQQQAFSDSQLRWAEGRRGRGSDQPVADETKQRESQVREVPAIQSRIVMDEASKKSADSDFRFRAGGLGGGQAASGPNALQAEGDDAVQSESERLRRYQQQLGQEMIAENEENRKRDRQDGAAIPPEADRVTSADEEENRQFGEVGQQAIATGWASLEVDFPTRGKEFRFTTPHGMLELSVTAVDGEATGRAARGAIAVVVAFVLFIAQRVVSKRTKNE